MDIFSTCHKINDLISQKNETSARNELIKLLDHHKNEGIDYSDLVNHLIRETGLYPYLQLETSSWADRYVYESFRVDVGLEQPLTLHREQSLILKQLIQGKSLAVSAPTSFGKSFIIDAFISIKRPKNVVIIVPTIALMDETRRRLHKKFSDSYKIITTSDVEPSENNIFIFPQERAFSYVEKIIGLDILIIDEFYKASSKFDKERSPALIKTIMHFGRMAKQRYFLAPNISSLGDNPFTKGMEFVRLDFNTVFLQKFDVYKTIDGDEDKKSAALIEIIADGSGKSLIYVASYPNIDKVSVLLIDQLPIRETAILKAFKEWLSKNYASNWSLTTLIKRGVGIHNGQLHRSLSQIQIKLFEQENGINHLISTSSIIEGVNTSAEKVIVWSNRKGGRGNPKLDDFTYKNIIGRGGRMFKYFIGKIYLLESPPDEINTNLELSLPDALLGDINEDEFSQELTSEQISKIIQYREELDEIIGFNALSRLQKENLLQSCNANLIRTIAIDLKNNQEEWNGMAYLNSDNPDDWERILFKAINLIPGGWDAAYGKFVNFIKALAGNWHKSIPQLLQELDNDGIGIDLFFKLERNATFKMASLLNDINALQKEIYKDPKIDISPFVAKLSRAFLPHCVYQLEEYGLPRMLSKKIHGSKLIDFSNPDLTLHAALATLKEIGLPRLLTSVKDLDHFDIYILDYFFDGITNEEVGTEQHVTNS